MWSLDGGFIVLFSSAGVKPPDLGLRKVKIAVPSELSLRSRLRRP